MASAEDELIRSVSERLDALGTTAFAVEKSAGLPEDAVRSILRGGKKSGTTLNRARDVCEALGLELYVGPPRSAESGAWSGLAEAASGIDLGKAEALRAGYLPIPWHDLARQSRPVPEAFSRDWLSQAGLDPARLACAVATRTRLPDCVPPGALVLLDRNAPRAGPVRTWLWRDGLDLVASRVMWLPDGGSVAYGADAMSTPPEYRARDATAGLTVLGQVVWVGCKIT